MILIMHMHKTKSLLAITMEIIQLLMLASFFLFLKLTLTFKRRKTAPNLPPGPRKLPLIGNMHNLIGSVVPHRALHNLSLKYGPLMHLQLGELSAVVVSSPEAAKEAMKTHDVNFASRPPILAAEIMGYACTSITFAPYGDYWRQLRKVCTLELLSLKRVRSFRSIRERVFADATRWMASNEGSAINLTEKLYSLAYDVISRAVLGNKTKLKDKLLEILQETITLAAGFDAAELYPSSKLLQMMSRSRHRLMRLQRHADPMLEEIICEHKAAIAAMNDDERGKHEEDLLGVLLKLQDDGLELPLTMDNVKAVMMDMLGAGSETSATTIDWVMAEMLRNPIILKKAQDEVRRVFDEKGYVDESNIDELKYLKSVIKETLRLHPPLPLLLPRKCIEKCEMNGYNIPRDTKIIVNAWAINRDPKYWENANKFEPERFLDSAVDYRGNYFEYIPFGAGRRICPGMNFGLANVELPLAMFLYHFDWSLPVGMKQEELDLGEGFGVTARRVKDLYVVPHVRRHLPVK